MKFRPLFATDFDKGFIETLSTLVPVSLPRDRLGDVLRARIKSGICSFVLEHEGRVVATASVLYEPKFYHGGNAVAHVEDVVVHPDFRGKGVGKKLMTFLNVEIASKGCYKIILGCEEKNVGFYVKLGYYRHENHMRKDL